MESSTLDGNWRNATQEDPPPAPGNPSAFAPPHGLVDGRYRIERELGRGGMGRVYVARDERLLREVALKVLAPGHHDDVRLRRFEHEARAAGSLQHQNILVVHDVGKHEGEPYIITELLEGETLRELLRKRPREPEEAVALALQIAHGLAAAHEHGIVHRDLKPENLFLTKDGTVKILDFGVARLPDDFSAGDGSCTVTGAVLGTVSYMAPEQVRGQQVDARADLFAFGSVLHEMLSGSSPFARSTALETAHAILADPPAPLPGGVPAPLARIVERCLEKDPSDRFASARELVQALSPPARARRWTTAIAAGMLATAIAVAVLLLPLPHPGPPSRRIVVAAADFSNETEEKDLNGLSGMLITSLEQSKRLSVLTRGHMFDVLKQIGRGDVERIDEALGREICKQANADALVLAGIRRFGEVYAIDVKVLDPVKNEYLFTTGEQGKGKESIPAMIDRLSARTRAGLREKAEEIRAASVPVAQTTTANLEAYQFYFQGERSFSLARFGEAVSDFRRAIQLDPKFALAHFALGEALAWTLLMPGTGRAEPAEALKTAVRLGLPEKEGCLAQAELARRRNEWERAIALVDACAARFPEHKLTLLTAGDWRFHRNDVHGAARYLEKTVALDPTFKPAVEHLLALWQVMERPDKALELGRAFAGRVHDEEAYPLLAFAQQVAGDPQGAIATLRESARLFPLSAGPPFGLATAYLFAGDPDQAKIELQPVLDGKYGEKDGGAAYWLDVYGGRFRAAVARLDDRMLRAR
ncbi:MAG: protein kinase domain-containing protein, partial [Myxococcales bacterium]